jgi:hypothetical protein
MATLKEDLQRFPWGTITNVHTLGKYTLIEYVQKEIFNSVTNGHTLFSGYVNDKGTSQSWGSLEAGIIGLITRNKLGANNDAAATLICRGLGLEE